MFTTQHYRVLAGILHEAHKSKEWATVYDLVYTPLVKELEADNPKFDSLTFSWAVATGDFSNETTFRGDLLTGSTRDTAEQVRKP